MSRYGLTLRTAPPGLLLTAEGTLVFKTEYAAILNSEDGQPDVYVAASGERFWGGTSDHKKAYDVLCWEVGDACESAAREAMELDEPIGPEVAP